MAKAKENRKIPDLIISEDYHQSNYDAFKDINTHTEDYTCFGVTPENVRVLCLKVIFGNGAMVLIQYSRMMSPITFNGTNEMKLNTPTLQLIIRGANLETLMEFLSEHRLSWINSSGAKSMTDSMMMRKGEPEISTIQIHSKAKQKQDDAQT